MASTLEAASESRTSPAYVAFATFKNFIGHLKVHGIPSKVDKSVMGHLSGGTQSHLQSTLRYLGLVGSDQSPSDTLSQLAEAHGTDDWSDVLASVIKEAYADVVSDIDIMSATPNELDKCFEAKGMKGTMNDRAVRFYLTAMKDAGITFSTHFKNRKPRGSRSPNGKRGPKPKKEKETPKSPLAAEDKDQTPPGMLDYPVHFSGGREGLIRVPADLTEEDCKMIELTIPLIQAYASSN